MDLHSVDPINPQFKTFQMHLSNLKEDRELALTLAHRSKGQKHSMFKCSMGYHTMRGYCMLFN